MLTSKKLLHPVYILVSGILLLDFLFFVYSCNRTKNNDSSPNHYLTSSAGYKDVSNKSFVGSEACKSCHEKQYEQWQESVHYHAMGRANAKNVRGDFNNVNFTVKGVHYRFFKKDGAYMVHTKGADGTYQTYKIAYTFGWSPLQQYLIKFPRGKYQVLTAAWDTKTKKWFSLYPHTRTKPGDYLFWTGVAMNWNTMCADCHSTNIHQNYFSKADSFHTTWSSINVGCEACHGPGRKHIQYIKSLHGKRPNITKIRSQLEMTSGTSSHMLVDECARCHSLRTQVSKAYNFRGMFMDHYEPELPHPPNYFADGQKKKEDYVYASFLQSKMFHDGIACINCHNPHTYKLIATGNNLCLRCHGSKYNTFAHTHHKLNTAGSACINCHMPSRYYMQVQLRRDHSFRIPRPDLTELYGVPNACNSCHKDKSAKWAEQAIKKWYGSPTPKNHFYRFTRILARANKVGPKDEGELLRLVNNKSEPGIARATAIWYLGQFLDNQSEPVVAAALNSHNAIIRISAVRALSNLSPSVKGPLLEPMIMDSVRSVRVAAMQGLADLSKSDFPESEQTAYDRAYKELKQSFQITQYFPGGQFNQGEYYQGKKEWGKAIRAYQKAIVKNPHFNEARINLADIYNELGENRKAEVLLKTVIEQEPDYGPAYYSMALLLGQEGKLKESLGYFEQASKHMGSNARMDYNWAIVYQKLKRYKESEQKYLKAIKLDPSNVEFQYGIVTLYMQNKKYKKALFHADRLIKLQPDNSNYQQLIEILKSKLAK